MRDTNNILLNMLKRQLLAIYRAFDKDEPDKKKSPAMHKAYYALLTVENNDEFRQWQKMVSDLGLGFSNHDGVEYSHNLLGELDDLASKADEATLTEFMSWMVSLDNGWKHFDSDNQEQVRKIHKVAGRFYDVHIVIVLCGKQWVAIGNDADRLFEIFGWQTSVTNDGKKDIPFMFISEYGYKVLMESGYSVKTLCLKDEYKDDDKVFVSDCFDEDLVCGQQQLIDYMRLLVRKHYEIKMFMTEKMSFKVPKSGYDLLVNARLSIDEDKVIAITDEGKQITLADGKSWRLDKAGLPFMFKIQRLSDWNYLN